MPKSRSPTFRAALALGANVLSGGLWALIDPQSLSRFAVPLVILGGAIVALAYFWEEIRGYRKWKRGPRHVYITWTQEPLPTEAPPGHFKRYFIIEGHGEHGGVAQLHYGYSEHRGEMPQVEGERPRCERVEITNHSDAALVNVVLEMNVTPTPLNPGDDPLNPFEMLVEFEQIPAGQSAVSFIINETRFVAHASVLKAFGTPVGRPPAPLDFNQKRFGLMVFYPHPRFREPQDEAAAE